MYYYLSGEQSCETRIHLVGRLSTSLLGPAYVGGVSPRNSSTSAREDRQNQGKIKLNLWCQAVRVASGWTETPSKKAKIMLTEKKQAFDSADANEVCVCVLLPLKD